MALILLQADIKQLDLIFETFGDHQIKETKDKRVSSYQEENNNLQDLPHHQIINCWEKIQQYHIRCRWRKKARIFPHNYHFFTSLSISPILKVRGILDTWLLPITKANYFNIKVLYIQCIF